MASGPSSLRSASTCTCRLFSSTTRRGQTISISSFLETTRLRRSTSATRRSKARPPSLSGWPSCRSVRSAGRSSKSLPKRTTPSALFAASASAVRCLMSRDSCRLARHGQADVRPMARNSETFSRAPMRTCEERAATARRSSKDGGPTLVSHGPSRGTPGPLNTVAAGAPCACRAQWLRCVLRYRLEPSVAPGSAASTARGVPGWTSSTGLSAAGRPILDMAARSGVRSVAGDQAFPRTAWGPATPLRQQWRPDCP